MALAEKPPLSPNKQEIMDHGKQPFILFTERWRLAMIAFVGFFFVYSLRVNMSVAIVCMAKAENVTNGDADTNGTCGALDVSSSDEDTGEFDWDKDTQTGMLSSFFYGYLFLQVPGGWLAGRFGGRRVLGTALTVVASATLALPALTRLDYRFVYALRAIMGLASGVSFPAMQAMWGKWAPPGERSRLASLSYTGVMAGNIGTFIFSGYLCGHGFDHGWGSIFYLTGGACFVWLAAWWLLVSDTPDTCSRITKAERDYIVNSIGDTPQQNFSVPWKAVVMSRAMWVCLVAHFCNSWMHYTLVTSLPTFMKEVLHYDIEQNGVLSSVPYMAMAVTAVLGGHVVDYITGRCLSTRTTRRAVQCISFLGSGACLVAVGFVSCENRTQAVVLLAVAVGFEGLSYSGYMVNQIDFAPRYAGVLFGLTNFIATIPGILAPTMVGGLTPHKTQEEWRRVFYVCGSFTLLGAIVFGGFAQTDPEPWARDPDDDDNDAHNMEITIDAKPQHNSGGANNGTLVANGNTKTIGYDEEDDKAAVAYGNNKAAVGYDNGKSHDDGQAVGYDNKGMDASESDPDGTIDTRL